MNTAASELAVVDPAALSPTLTSADEELPRRVVIATMAGVIAAMLLASLDGTIVGTAMPRVIAELQGFEHYAAVTTVYLLASTVVMPIVGKLSDLYGRRAFLLGGVLVFVVGSVLCAIAQSMEQLVAFRALQGLGAGASQGMAFTTIADLFPPAKRGKITGVMGAVFGLSSIIGPAVGGWLTDGPGWRACFWINLPIGAVALSILWWAYPARPTVSSSNSVKPRVDVAGALVLVAAAVPLLTALSMGGRDAPWVSAPVLSLLGFGLLMAALFVRIERRAAEPLMPPHLFGDRVIAVSSVAACLVAMAMFGTLLFVPLFLQGVVGVSASQSGSAMTPMMVSMIVSSVVGGNVMTRLGRTKAPALVGVALTTVGMALLARMDVDTGFGSVVVRMMVVGAGLGLTLPVFSLAVQNAAAQREVGTATATLQFLRALGGAVGAAVFGAVLAGHFHARFQGALQAALPPSLSAQIPATLLQQLDDPQVLMNPEAQAALRAAAEATPGLIEPLLVAVRATLSSSLQLVFALSAALLVLALGVLLFLEDRPLRQSNRDLAPR